MNQIETLEDALEAVADSIDSSSFVGYVRKGLEADTDLHYKLAIKNTTQGIVVSFVAEKKFPVRPLKTFIRLR